jgi:two-component system invasion response regulator UvrY
MVRTGLVRMLNDIEGFCVVSEAASGEEAYAYCRKSADLIDVVLMDMRMPGMGGMEATRRISRAFASIRVIALSSCKNELVGRQFLHVGAQGFLSKDDCFTNLVTAIRSVSSGVPYLCRDLAQSLALLSMQGEQSPFARLTERELQICLMIVEGKKISAIADCLHVLPKSINTYRYRMFDKLQVDSDVAMTRLAIAHGLIEISQTASG